MLCKMCRLNLASYVSTWMEDAADEIFSFAKNVNLADSVQYPSSALMERRRVCSGALKPVACNLYPDPDPVPVLTTYGAPSPPATIAAATAFQCR